MSPGSVDTRLARLRAIPWTSALVLIALSLACARGESPQELAALEEVRGHLLALDPHSALRAAESALDAGHDSRELQAWRLIAATRADAMLDVEGEARALAELDDDPWGQAALAGVRMEEREGADEALEASERALERAPEDPVLLWLHLQALIAAGEHERAVELVDARADEVDEPAPLIHQKSRALYYLAYAGRGIDPDLMEESRAASERARTLDPELAAAWFGEGTVFFAQGRHEEAFELLERAAELSPGSLMIQQRVGQTLLRLRDLTDEERDARTAVVVETLLAVHPDEPAALQAVARLWESAGLDERQREVEERILAEFPDSLAAEWLAVNEYREAGREFYEAKQEGREPDPEMQAEYERLLREFLARPRHNQPRLKGDAFRSLYSLLTSAPDPEPDELLRVVDGMVEFEGINPHIAFAGGAKALAEHTDHHERAEEIARLGIEEARRKVESQRSMYENEGEVQRAQQRFDGIMYDALGWVLFRAGRTEEAEAALLRAYDSDPKNRDTLYDLGRFYQARGDIAEAERFFIQGLAAQAPGENPNRAALADLYEKRTGGTAGFEAYVTDVETREARERRERILAERIDEPEPVKAFELELLGGGSVRSQDLTGQVTVINFWGIWCGWCVIEMPELQQLHERYSDDSDVRILTINNDPDPDDVPPWMDEKGYDLEVLLDDGFIAGDAGVAVFPTTWFLDREGRLAFVKTGWSQELLEEFTWRIEELR